MNRSAFPVHRTVLIWTGILCLSATLAAELALSVREQSQTFDEACHIYAGYQYWRRADFGVNPEHPPLVKWLASLPLLWLRPQIPNIRETHFKIDGFLAGNRLLYSNDADALLFRARVAAALLTLFLALLVFEAGYRMFGVGPAFIALALTVFEPNLLAHGALVTTDMGLTACLFASVYAFYRYAKQPSARTLLVCGLVAGVVLVVKHSGILVLPILGLLALGEILMAPRLAAEPSSEHPRIAQGPARQAFRMAAALLVITAISVSILWAAYGFRFQARPDNLKITPPLAEFIRGTGSPGLKNRHLAQILLRLERWRLLPESYLYGLADVAIANEGRPTFIFSKVYPRGRWFYFPGAFLIKSTFGFLMLLLLIFAATKLRRPAMRRELLFLVIPAVFYFAISLTSRLNIGIRHILPIYPFLLVFAGAGAWTLIEKGRRWAYCVSALIAFHAYSSAKALPNYLAYSNELWGGTARTYRVLTDSNVDWGQGLIAVKNYLDRHRISECWLAYHGSADPAYYRIPCKPLPDPFSQMFGKPVEAVPPVLQGKVLVSATNLSGFLWGPGELNPYRVFSRSTPVENLGGAILVFSGTFDFALGSAWSRLMKAWELVQRNQLDQALAEARTAVALAPRSLAGRYTLGFLLAMNKQVAQARQEYQAALAIARKVHPEFQSLWVPLIERQLKQL